MIVYIKLPIIYHFRIKTGQITMKRRIILMGGKTYVVSIPSEYVKKYGLKKGDELECEDKGSNITFRNNRQKIAEVVSIVLNERDDIGKTLRSLYERGYDEIEVKLENRKLADLEKNLSQLPGFELISSGKNSCTIKCLSNICTEEFENMLRRLFLMIKSIPESIQEDKNEALNKINTAKRLSLLCKRCLSKKEFENYNKTLVYYSLLNEIESILVYYEGMLKEKNIIFKDISIAAEIAYDALYKNDARLENIKQPLTKSLPFGALANISLTKIAVIAQGLRIV